MARGIDERFTDFAEETLQVVAAAGVMKRPADTLATDDMDEAEEIDDRREQVLELLSSVIQGMRKTPERLVAVMRPSVPIVFELLDMITAQEPCRPEIIGFACGLLHDMISPLGGLVAPALSKPFVKRLCEREMRECSSEIGRMTLQQVNFFRPDATANLFASPD